MNISNQLSSILKLTDDELMLALCIRPERLKNPARWCNESRVLAIARHIGPKSVAEADEIDALNDRLNDEYAGVLGNYENGLSEFMQTFLKLLPRM